MHTCDAVRKPATLQVCIQINPYLLPPACNAYARTKLWVFIFQGKAAFHQTKIPQQSSTLSFHACSGLKYGMYSDAGSKTCLGLPGSRGNEELDAQYFADLGVDFLKYDNCHAPASDWIVDRYSAMRDALNKTGRPILFSMCNWGAGDPWKWAQQVHALTALLYTNCLLLIYPLSVAIFFVAVVTVAVVAVAPLRTSRTASSHDEQVYHPACTLRSVAPNTACLQL